MGNLILISEALLVISFFSVAIVLFLFLNLFRTWNRLEKTSKDVKEENIHTITFCTVFVVLLFITFLARSFYIMFVNDVPSLDFLFAFYNIVILLCFLIFLSIHSLFIMNRTVKDGCKRDYFIYIYWVVYFIINWYFVTKIPNSSLLSMYLMLSLFSQLLIGSTLIIISFFQRKYSNDSTVFWLLLVSGLILPFSLTIKITSYSLFSSYYNVLALLDSLIRFISAMLALSGILRLVRVTWNNFDGYYKDHIGKRRK